MKFIVYKENPQEPEGIGLEIWSGSQVGVFETLRIYNRKIFRLEEHLERMMESAKTVGCNHDFNISRIRKVLMQAARRFNKPAGILRVSVTNGQISVLTGTRSQPESLYRKGVRVKTSAVPRTLSQSAPPEAKTSAFQNSIFAALDSKGKSASEQLFLDRQGFIKETGVGNVFSVIQEPGSRQPLLQTPPAEGILNGVTRRFVIECAFYLKILTRETPLTRHDLFNASEVFLTNTSWEILPVCEIDARRIGRGIPGPVSRRIHREFKKRVQKECRKKK